MGVIKGITVAVVLIVSTFSFATIVATIISLTEPLTLSKPARPSPSPPPPPLSPLPVGFNYEHTVFVSYIFGGDASDVGDPKAYTEKVKDKLATKLQIDPGRIEVTIQSGSFLVICEIRSADLADAENMRSQCDNLSANEVEEICETENLLGKILF